MIEKDDRIQLNGEWLAAIMTSKDVSKSGCAVAGVIYCRVNYQNGFAFPCIDRLARESHISKRSAQVGVNELEDAGFLKVIRPDINGRGRSSKYYPIPFKKVLSKDTDLHFVISDEATSSDGKMQKTAPILDENGVSKSNNDSKLDNDNPLTPSFDIEAVSKSLLVELGQYVKYFRGSLSGQQEAHDIIKGLLTLYQPDYIKQVIELQFKTRRRPLDIKDVPEILDQFEIDNGQQDNGNEIENDSPLISNIKSIFSKPENVIAWRKISGQESDNLESVLKACRTSSSTKRWAEEIINEHFKEVQLS